MHLAEIAIFHIFLTSVINLWVNDVCVQDKEKSFQM